MIKTFLFTMGVIFLLSMAENTSTIKPGNATDTWDQDKISDFVEKAAQGGMMEVQLGQLAQQKAASREVKDFGQMMVNDHSSANQKLKSVAQGMQVDVPGSLDSKHQDQVDDLADKGMENFDEAYMDLMVEDHKKDIDEFEEAQNNLPDGDLKNWVDNTLPTLRDHLRQAQQVQSQIK